MTPDEALLWLAGLEKDCPESRKEDGCVDGIEQGYRPFQNAPHALCNGTGKVPVLDLRESCQKFHQCSNAGCLGWVARTDRNALHEAMHKNGWNLTLLWRVLHTAHPNEGLRDVTFWRFDNGAHGTDSDDHVAAVKAMQAAGYL